MHSDVEAATQRVIATRARVVGLRADGVLRQEVEDELCAGYAHALAGDAWLADSERRLHELIDDVSLPVRGRELRALAAEHAKFQRSVIELRRELAALRREYDRLRAGAGASR